MTHQDLTITAELDSAIEEGREHFGRFQLAKKNLSTLSFGSRQRLAAQESFDAEEAELARIAARIGVSAGVLCEMIEARVTAPSFGRHQHDDGDVDAASLWAEVERNKGRMRLARNSATLAQVAYIDASRVFNDSIERYRAHCAKPLVRA